jgi:hypothetical protein
MPSGIIKIIIYTIALIAKHPVKNYFLPYLSDKLGRIGLKSANPRKKIPPKSPIIYGSVQVRS